MDPWTAVAQSAAGPWWGSAFIGFIGGVVGAGATLLGGTLSDRRKARHADALQWDEHIVKLAERFLTSIDKVLRSRPSSLQPVTAEQAATYDTLCDEEHVNQTATLGQLELIAPAEVRVAGLKLQNECFDLVRENYAITPEGLVRRESSYPKVRELRGLFVEAVRQAIRR